MVRTLSETGEIQRARNEMMNLLIDHATLTIWPRDRGIEMPNSSSKKINALIQMIVDEAVLEERERCAVIAWEYARGIRKPTAISPHQGDHIALAIREGK